MEDRQKPQKPQNQAPTYRHIKTALIVLGAILAVVCLLLVGQYFALRRENLINLREMSLSAFVAKHGALTADETGVIRPWMTFDYVNRIFGLPSGFLKTSFRIQNPAYPNLTLSQYASEEGFTESEFLAALKAAIGNYVSSTPH